MDGNKISDCVSILNKLLKPATILSSYERKELLNFFVEEKIKSVKICDKPQTIISIIKEKKKNLAEEKRYEEIARLRDLEKSYEYIVAVTDEFRRNKLAASFRYGINGLMLIIVEGEYNHTIEELKILGLHLSFFPSKGLP